MSYSKIFFSCCLFFILGVFLRSVFEFDFFMSYLILLFALLFLILTFKNRYFFILGLWGIFLFLGIWRYQASLPNQNPNKIYFYNGQKAEIRGIIDKEPDQREDKVRLELKSQEILINGAWQKISGKILLTNYLYPEYNYGDKLEIVCDLQKPAKVQDFNYDDYLARYDIYSLCYYSKITLLKENQGNFILANIYRLKGYFVFRINQVLPEPQSSFLAGLLIGAKRAIPADLQSAFNKTGTTHIVAVSGYNVTIIVVFLMLLAQNLFLPRKKTFWLITGFLIIFVILTGLQASCLRAAIMAEIVLIATYLGRLSKLRNVLALTACLMLLANSKILVFDLGFQLSFLATLGLIYLNPILNEVCKVKKFIKLKSGQIILGDYLLTTLSAIIMTQPIILYNFGKISLIAPLANILILPFIPLAMLLGFIIGIFAMIWTSLGWVAGWSVWLVLTYVIWVLEKLANLNWAYYQFSKINFWLMVFLYIIIVGFIYRFRRYLKLA